MEQKVKEIIQHYQGTRLPSILQISKEFNYRLGCFAVSTHLSVPISRA
jgi:hypothetical protein